MHLLLARDPPCSLCCSFQIGTVASFVTEKQMASGPSMCTACIRLLAFEFVQLEALCSAKHALNYSPSANHAPYGVTVTVASQTSIYTANCNH